MRFAGSKFVGDQFRSRSSSKEIFAENSNSKTYKCKRQEPDEVARGMGGVRQQDRRQREAKQDRQKGSRESSVTSGNEDRADKKLENVVTAHDRLEQEQRGKRQQNRPDGDRHAGQRNPF